MLYTVVCMDMDTKKHPPRRFKLVGGLKSAFPDDPDWLRDRSAQNRYRIWWLLIALFATMMSLFIQYCLAPPDLSPWIIDTYRIVALVFCVLAVLMAVPAFFMYKYWKVPGRDSFAQLCSLAILVCGTLLTWLDNQEISDISAWIVATLVPPVFIRMPARRWMIAVAVASALLVLSLVLYPPVAGVTFNYTMFVVSPVAGFLFSQIMENSYKESWHYRTLLERKNAELQDISLRDGLTGIFNRRAFNEFLEHSFAGSRRSKQDLVLLMVDIDYFKRVNDTWGHPAGDGVICTTANCINESIRNSDLLARYGGEEFAVILANTPLTESVVVAERIRKRVAETSMPAGVGQVTVSVGGAGSGQARDAANLLVLADQALYAAKSGGRNRTVINSGPSINPV